MTTLLTSNYLSLHLSQSAPCYKMMFRQDISFDLAAFSMIREN